MNNSGMGSHGRASNSANDLGRLGSADDLPGKRMVPGQALGGIAANLCLTVVQAQAGKILREALVKPLLGRRIVEIQKQTRKIMRHRPPAVFSSEIEHDVVAVVSGQKKSRSGNGLALPKRSHADVLFVRLQGDHIERFRHLQFGLEKELGKNVPHLLQAQAGFAPFLFPRIGEHGEMSRTYPDPLGFGVARETAGKEAMAATEQCSE